MLGNKDATAVLAVKDLNAAKKFYEGTLGLTPADSEEPGGILYRSGNSTVLVYTSQFAGTNKATAVTWNTGDDLQGVIVDLKSKGVSFEHYDMPNVTREGDIHIMGDMKAAWFKDPDGNIIALINR